VTNGLSSDIAPLTFGQMSVWRDIDDLPRARWHEANTALTVPIPNGRTTREIEDVLATLDTAHVGLRTQFNVDDPDSPVQYVLPPRCLFGVQAVTVQPDHIDDATRAIAAQPIDIGAGRPWSATVIHNEDEPERRTLVISKHHIACDAWSVGLIENDLTELLRSSDHRIVPSDPGTLLALARSQRSSSVWQSRREATLRHFGKVFSTPAAQIGSPSADHGVLMAATESRELYDAASAVARQTDVSVATVFIAAYAAEAKALSSNERGVRMDLMSSNRFNARFDSLVTSMNQWIPVTFDRQHDFGVDNLQSTGLAALRAYRLGSYDVDLVRPESFGLRDITETSPTCSFNFVTPSEAQYPPDESVEPEVHWESPFSSVGPACYLRAMSTTAGTIRLRLRTNGLAPETVSKLLLGVHFRVLEYATRLRSQIK
jgi:hypothetical protein